MDDLTVDLFAWDAGTEDGTGFSIDNAESSPLGVIELVDQAAVFGGNAPIARATFSQVVPEPGTSPLGLLAALALVAFRRHRR